MYVLSIFADGHERHYIATQFFRENDGTFTAVIRGVIRKFPNTALLDMVDVDLENEVRDIPEIDADDVDRLAEERVQPIPFPYQAA